MAIYKIYVLDPKDWDLWFDAIPWTQRPRKLYTPKQWSIKNGNPTLTTNLTYFNWDSAEARRADTVYACTQYLRIMRYASDCGYAGYESSAKPANKNDGKGRTVEKIILPNGDIVSGYSLGIKNGVVVSKSTSGLSCRNGIGITKDGKYIVAQTNAITSVKTFCSNVLTKVKKLGYDIDLFFEMDGGGSVGTYSSKSKLLFAPKKEGADGRTVASCLCMNYKGNMKITRTLKKGCSGEDVKLLQIILGTVEADGIYGNGTVSAVKSAQKALGLKADGIAGPITLKALGLQ